MRKQPSTKKSSTKPSDKSRRSAPAKANHKAAKPNHKVEKVAVKSTKPSKKQTEKPQMQAYRPVVVAAPPPPPPPAVLAPAKFRREYKRWKDLLISLRHRLLSEGSHLEEEGLKALEQEVSVDHMADFGSDSSEQETTLQLIESNSLSMRDVDDALKRIDIGSYGLCEDCEQLIPPARLAVLPHARFCISCQSKREGMPA